MIWQLSADVETYQQLVLVNSERDWEIPVYSFNGETLQSTWIPLQVQRANEEYLLGDFLAFTGNLVLGNSAVEIMHSLITEYVELLPLDCVDCTPGNYHAINVTTVLDCLNREQSEIEYFPDGDVMRVVKFVFKLDCIQDAPVFKIPEHPRNRTFVNDVFKYRVEENGLTGLKFTLISTTH